MADLRTEAEALAIGLEVGAVSVDESVEWAVAHILAVDNPHWALAEAATSSTKYPQDVAGTLRTLPGVPDAAASIDLLCQIIARRLAADHRHADAVASALYTMAIGDDIKDPGLKSISMWAWDALDLADARLVEESREDVVAMLLAQLRRYVDARDIAWSAAWTPAASPAQPGE